MLTTAQSACVNQAQLSTIRIAFALAQDVIVINAERINVSYKLTGKFLSGRAQHSRWGLISQLRKGSRVR